jgi:hypothetical protein
VTNPEQGPTELPPTVPNAVPGQNPTPGQAPPPAAPSSPVFPPGVAAVPPAVDPYAPRYGDTGYQPAPAYGPPDYGTPGYGAQPGYPPFAQPPKRRTGLIVGIVAAVLVLCLGGGAVAAILALRNLDAKASPTGGPSNQPPPTSQPATEPTADPTTPPSDFTGDLRSLLVPRPNGAEPWQDFASKDGNLDLNTAADLFQDPDAMRKDLTDMNFERGAVNHWSDDDDIDVLIILFQFESADDAEDFVDSTRNDGIEDHDERGDFGDVPGSLTYVANKDDSNGKRSVIFLSNNGNIVSQVVVWRPDSVDLDSATDLAMSQHQRLP